MLMCPPGALSGAHLCAHLVPYLVLTLCPPGAHLVPFSALFTTCSLSRRKELAKTRSPLARTGKRVNVWSIAYGRKYVPYALGKSAASMPQMSSYVSFIIACVFRSSISLAQPSRICCSSNAPPLAAMPRLPGSNFLWMSLLEF